MYHLKAPCDEAKLGVYITHEAAVPMIKNPTEPTALLVIGFSPRLVGHRVIGFNSKSAVSLKTMSPQYKKILLRRWRTRRPICLSPPNRIYRSATRKTNAFGF
ncbi:hypothetical protein CEXT_426461 [Caerostris extrusa]|uniref:Uncharacterized protein n=1 Tax=Caerostris extrusa TaxID=172846 RepID=A0AAV4Y4K9_CAEEX|nr:hypothetical protein CEXT_426461 [Caerostris extrusa]